MDVTRDDRQRLAELLGALSLGGHAVPVALVARDALTLPAEKGGLFLGPLFGLPAALAALLLATGAVLLATGRPAPPAYGALVVVGVFDVLALASGGPALLVLAALASATSLGLFLSALRLGRYGA